MDFYVSDLSFLIFKGLQKNILDLCYERPTMHIDAHMTKNVSLGSNEWFVHLIEWL